MKHIFISYSRKDAVYLRQMQDRLIHQGYKPWIDPAPRPGQDWRYDIDDAIRVADGVIVLLTPNSAQSVYVTYEWSLALGMGVRVIPVIFKPARLHPRLETLERFALHGFTEESHFWDFFMRELPRVLQMPPPPPPPPVDKPPTSPLAPDMAMPEPVPQPPAMPQATYSRDVMPTEGGYWLVIRRGPNLNQMYRLDADLLTVGRDITNDITINDPEVSRYHLRLQKEGITYVAEDLGSTNGTVLDNKRLVGESRPLNPGDALMLGDTIIVSYEVV